MNDTEPVPAASGLRVRGLSIVYPSARGAAPLTAVDGVDLDVPRGQILALLGASGSGKSSLLRAVAGLEDITAGTITWDGDDVVPVPVHRRGFGLMFQDGQLFPFRDVAGNIGYGLAGRPRAERARRVEEVLDVVGLPGYGARAVNTLSGGQAQRVVLARALAPRPRLLLLDEPLSALDRALREQLAAYLRGILKAQGTTALYVTHDQDEAMTVADRVGVMEAGRLLRLDTPERLWAAPCSARVARFLGFGPVLDADAAARLGWSALLKGRPGEYLALAPGALTAVGVDAGNGDDGGAPGGGAASTGTVGCELSVRARVAAVRMRGGRRVVEVGLAGQTASAVSSDGDAEPVRAGQEVTVQLDPRRTAVVRA